MCESAWCYTHFICFTKVLLPDSPAPAGRAYTWNSGVLSQPWERKVKQPHWHFGNYWSAGHWTTGHNDACICTESLWWQCWSHAHTGTMHLESASQSISSLGQHSITVSCWWAPTFKAQVWYNCNWHLIEANQLDTEVAQAVPQEGSGFHVPIAN